MKLTIGFVLAAFLAFTQAIPVSKSEIQEKAVQGLRLLQFEEHLDPVWKTEDERLDYIRKNVNFVSLCSSRCQRLALTSVLSSMSPRLGNLSRACPRRRDSLLSQPVCIALRT